MIGTKHILDVNTIAMHSLDWETGVLIAMYRFWGVTAVWSAFASWAREGALRLHTGGLDLERNFVPGGRRRRSGKSTGHDIVSVEKTEAANTKVFAHSSWISNSAIVSR